MLARLISEITPIPLSGFTQVACILIDLLHSFLVWVSLGKRMATSPESLNVRDGLLKEIL
jgi:hypothetical protein